MSKIFLTFLANMAMSSQDRVPDAPATRPIPLMDDYVPPNDQWTTYPDNYRVLDCWQCFQAQGKVCMDKDHQSLFNTNHIETSKKGQIFCCKNDYNEGHCQDGGKVTSGGAGEIEMICSPPSFQQSGTGKFGNVISNSRNHQMFAYCPNIDHQRCGISDSLSKDMKLHAGLGRASVNAQDLKYIYQGRHHELNNRIIRSSEAEYDACYYEIVLDQSVLDTHNPSKLNVQINSKGANLNAFIYGGSSRKESTQSLNANNAQVTVGQTFQVDANSGFLIIAYPSDTNSNDFSFDFWVDATLKPPPGTIEIIEKPEETPEKNFFEKLLEGDFTDNKDLTFLILCGVASFIFLIIIIICCCCCCKRKKMKQAIADEVQLGLEDAVPIDMGAPAIQYQNPKSLELEDFNEDDLDNTVRDSPAERAPDHSTSRSNLAPKGSKRDLSQKYPGQSLTQDDEQF